MSEEHGGRDRLRELLDAVLDEDNHSLDEMAQDAFSSPYHFRATSSGASVNRSLTKAAGLSGSGWT